jgi:hypothetical protein
MNNMENIESKYLNDLKEDIKKQEKLAINKLESLANLPEIVEALRQSNSFKALGEALSPLTIYEDTQRTKEKPSNPKTPFKLYRLAAWFKSKQIKPLDALAGVFTLIIWLATSAWIIQTFTLTYACMIGVAVFWLFFIVTFRLMIGGILD